MSLPHFLTHYIAIAETVMPLRWWVVAALAFVILILLAIWLFKLERSHRRLMLGPDATHLGHSLLTLNEEVKDLTAFRSELELYLSEAEERIRGSIRGVSTVRFNPFRGTGSGGNQSFAAAFISEEGDGLVISSLHSREHVSIYAKPLRGGRSDFELTGEEQRAVKEAKANLKLRSPNIIRKPGEA